MRSTFLAAGALAAASLAGPAESRDFLGGIFGRDDGHYRRDAGRIAYDRGFHDGAKHGAKDGRKGLDFNFHHHGDYRDGDNGYRRSYGPRHFYQRAYRRGYEDGYRRGYETRIRGRYDYGYGGYDRGRAYERYDGRHRHPGVQGWCYEGHDDGDYDDWDDDGRIIYERPRRY